VGKPRFQRLAVLRGRCAPDADGHAHHQGHAALAAKHVAVLGRLVDDLVDGAQRKVHHAQLDHGPAAGQRHADGGADDGGLGDRRVDDAPGAEALRQRRAVRVAVLAEHAAAAQVFAQGDDGGVVFHRLRQGQRGGLRIGHGAPRSPLRAVRCPRGRSRLRRPCGAHGCGAHAHTPAPTVWMSV
jgi:hypothetical protein